MGTVVVSGALANKLGNGGATWVRLSWALGLRRLGLDVWFVEQIDPARCVDAHGRPAAFSDSENLEYFRRVTSDFGFADRATLVCGDGPRTAGLGYPELLDLAAEADGLVNISGHLHCEPLFGAFRRKVYVDLDPGYTQIWAAQGLPGARLAGHDLYVTVGGNIGSPGCAIPTAGVTWMPVRQPVTLDDWPVVPRSGTGRFTTVGAWRGTYGRVSHAGTSYGLKAHELRKIIDLPTRVDQQLELALDIHAGDQADIQLLTTHGWRLVDPKAVAGDPHAFRSYVQGSDAEFSVAQGIYVETRSGWFSDRTARYLASGKPALVQDTGLGADLPVGDGLLTFSSSAEAERGCREIHRRYTHHAAAARQLAEEFFDSDVVLGDLMAALDVTA